MGAQEDPPADHTEDGREVDPMESPLIARLRQARDKVLENRTLDLPVPGYPGEILAVRYRPIPRERWIEMGTDDDESAESDIAGVVESCEAILVKNEAGKYEELVDEKTGTPVRFDVRLAEYLQIEAEAAADVVWGVFCLDVHPLAVTNHVKAIIRWSQGLATKGTESLLGESTA